VVTVAETALVLARVPDAGSLMVAVADSIDAHAIVPLAAMRAIPDPARVLDDASVPDTLPRTVGPADNADTDASVPLSLKTAAPAGPRTGM
jgi:hypothetical protein